MIAVTPSWDNKEKKLIVNEDCRNVIDELRSWRWMTDPVSGATLDAPLALHDDAMAALRYATEPLRRARPRRSFSKDALGV